MAHHASPAHVGGSSFWASKPGYKPILILIALIVFSTLVVLPPPRSMINLVSNEKPSGYKLTPGAKNITDNINLNLRPEAFKQAQQPSQRDAEEAHSKPKPLLGTREAAQMAKVMLLIFGLAVFLWGTEALPLGATDILVAVMLYLFSILPIEEIGAGVRARDRLFLIDAAQTAGVLPIDVQAMNIDLLAFPGHKELLGPPGTGGLVVGERVRLRPIRQGGTGTRSEEEQQPTSLPEGFETGTLNSVGVAGLGAGVRFILETGIGRIRAHQKAVVQRLLRGLSTVPGLTIYGPCHADRQVGVVSVNLDRWEPTDLGVALDQDFEVAVRTGLHCAPLAHRTIGTFPTGTVRLSPGYFTTFEDVDWVITALERLARKWLRDVRHREGGM